MIQPIATLVATGNVDLGNASDQDRGYMAVQFTIGGGTLSAAVTGRLTGSNQAYLPLAYIDMATGLIATGAITAAKIILIDCSGLDVRLACTIVTGPTTIYAIPLLA